MWDSIEPTGDWLERPGRWQKKIRSLPGPPNGPLMEPLWPLIVGIWGIIEGSWGGLGIVQEFGV